MLDRYKILFDEVKIGPVTAPNRFFAVPHATGYAWNQPSGAIAIRAMKAEGGWGTVAVQITEISPDSDFANHPMERIWDDTDILRHAKGVEQIKKHGSLSAIELGHGGMRARNILSGFPVIGPSALPILKPEVPVQSKMMDLSDIKVFREKHKNAVKRSVKAGYDIIYVYAAHDLSILSHFLSIRTNQRSDEYGGSFSNRLRLLREVIEDALEIVDGKQAIALRFSVSEPEKSIGIRHDGEGRDVVEALAELPDLWDVNISGWPMDSSTSRFSKEGFQLEFTDFVKTITSKPVVGVGRFTSPDTMASLIKKNKLDFIGGARPSIADPFLPKKIYENKIDHIRECIGCNICVSMDGYGLPIRCTQNPTISEEWRRKWHPEIISKTKKTQDSFLIIGSGPSGLECARVLLNAGHKVTIAEAEKEAGGRIVKEASLPGLGEWIRVRDYRMNEINQNSNSEIYFSSRLSASDIKNFEADRIIFATGSYWRRDGVGSSNPHSFSLDRFNLYTPDDIFGNNLDIKSRAPVIVYDDDHFYMASVIAEKLALDGYKVTYVTPLASVATWTDLTLEQDKIVNKLNSLNVHFKVNYKLNTNGKFINTLSGDVEDFNTENIIFVGARLPNDELYNQAKEKMNNKYIFSTGDCVAPGMIQAAVFSGHSIARQIIDDKKNNNYFLRDQIETFNF